jgi:hypothetical protein
MLAITSVIIVLSLLFGGTGAAVVAAQDSLPGEGLYALKTLTEDIQLTFTHNQEKRLEKALDFVNNRFVEASILENEGQQWSYAKTTELTERLEKNLKDALLSAAAMDNPESGLTSIKDQIKVLYVAIQKRPQDQVSHDRPDGGNDHPQLRVMFRKSYEIVVVGLEDPQNFEEMILGRYGNNLERLDLFVISSDDFLLLTGELSLDKISLQDQQIPSGEGSYDPEAQFGYGIDGAQFAPHFGSDESSAQFKADENAGFGAGEPNDNGTYTQEKAGDNYQYYRDGTQNQSPKPEP